MSVSMKSSKRVLYAEVERLRLELDRQRAAPPARSISERRAAMALAKARAAELGRTVLA